MPSGATTPETRYVQAGGGVNIAFQVFGNGPKDLLFVWGPYSHLELPWEDDFFGHYLRRLGTVGRVIHFDKRGTGLSDRACPLPTLEEQMDDIVAVLDAAGSERPALIGASDAGQLCMLFAASHPERTAALILAEARPRITRSEGFPFGPEQADWQTFIEWLAQVWGQGQSQAAVAPSHDPRVSRVWWARLERYSLSPGSVVPFFQMFANSDVRGVLGSIHVPTLIIQRSGDPVSEIGVGRYLADHIPGSRLAVFKGTDHASFVGPTADAELDEIEEFLTGTRTVPDPRRTLATVLFTDIVGSTTQAAAVGDRRWRHLLDDHEAISKEEVDRHRGRWVKSTGDGTLATFDGPARAIRCAQAISSRLGVLGLEVRAGIHTGECEDREGDIGGIGVHIAARVVDNAAPGEVLVSGTVPLLVAGSGLRFDDKGSRELKGVPGTWHLFAVAN